MTRGFADGLRLCPVFFALIALALPLAASQRVTLAWDASPDATVAGYKVYYCDNISADLMMADAGNSTTLTLNLTETVGYSFCVVAYNAAGLESDPSNTVDFTIPMARVAPATTKDAQGRPVLKFFIEPVPNQRVALQASTNLVNWSTLAAAQIGQPLSCQITNTLRDAKRFFRSVCLP